jgi:hypothetical protein
MKDFNKTLASGGGVPLDNLRGPAVFVIKKNSSILKNLISWSSGVTTAPLASVLTGDIATWLLCEYLAVFAPPACNVGFILTG